jgi:hypothetical protein
LCTFWLLCFYLYIFTGRGPKLRGLQTKESHHASASSPRESAAVGLCDDVANMVTNGQPLLQQLEAIAQTIEGADLKAVAQLTALTATLETQFDRQEDTLTQSAIDSGLDVVSTAVDVVLAIGSEGEDIEPLVKGAIKLGQDAINEQGLSGRSGQATLRVIR